MKFYLKIENDQIIQAPDKISKNGYTIYGYNHENNEKMLFADGYAVYPASKYSYEIVKGKIELKKNIIQPRTVFKKLEIRKKLRQAGLQQDFEAILQANPQFKTDWNDAVEIDISEQPIAGAIQSGIIPAEMINAIKE